MHFLVETIRQWALGVGGLGLFLIALLDSSFLSFPQVADALVLLQSAHHPARLAIYAGAATVGSILGSLLLFRVGRAGGDAFLVRRFPARHVERAVRFYKRFGIFAVLVPAMLPPPAPLKLFVLLSGAAATETAVKRAVAGRRVVHLATHGFVLGADCEPGPAGVRAVGGLTRANPETAVVAEENPLLLTGLALAGANRRGTVAPDGDEGILTADEIARLNLQGTE